MKCSVHACLLVLALAPLVLAQPAQKGERDLWLVRSQNITNDLLKDASDLSSMQRAVLWAKLAQRWWREDQKRARTWGMNAIEIVEQVPNKETEAERDDRLDAARALVTILTPLDQKFTQKLMTVLTPPNKSGQPDGNGSADALIDAAVAVLKDDPKRAAEIGALALRSGAPDNLDLLLLPLRASEPKLADSLFEQALVVARQRPSKSMILSSLMYIAFPVQRGASPGTLVPPESMRAELLQIYVSLITDSTTAGEKQNLTCGIVSWLAPVFSEIERLLPKQWLVVRQAINQCQSASPLAHQLIDDATRTEPLDTVESLLNAAAGADQMEVRTVYKYRAANLARQHNEYERALKILDDMSKEEREFMGESWESFKWNWAADGAIEYYKNGRFREMNLLLDGTSSDLQAYAKAAFIVWLPEQAVSETAPVIQILNDAIKELRRSNIPETYKYNWYFGLLPSIVKYQPTDANAVLKDAIASLNQIKDGEPLNATDWLKYLGPSLVEMDEFAVKDALGSITPVPFRAKLRLALLDAVLQRLRSPAKAL